MFNVIFFWAYALICTVFIALCIAVNRVYNIRTSVTEIHFWTGTIGFLCLGGILAYKMPVAYMGISTFIGFCTTIFQILSKNFLRQKMWESVVQIILVGLAWAGCIPLVIYLLIHDREITYRQYDKDNA